MKPEWGGAFDLLRAVWAEYRGEATECEDDGRPLTPRERLADFFLYVAAHGEDGRNGLVNGAADRKPNPADYGPPCVYRDAPWKDEGK